MYYEKLPCEIIPHFNYDTFVILFQEKKKGLNHLN